MRKLLAAVAFLVITGVLPAVASAGICAAQRCCHSHPVASRPGCCSETNCSTAPVDEFTQSTKDAHLHSRHIGLVAEGVIAPVRRLLVPDCISTHPGSPPIRQRLATLSILLI